MSLLNHQNNSSIETWLESKSSLTCNSIRQAAQWKAY